MSFELFHNLLYAWMALAIIVFVLLLFIKVPYGRHTTDKWGPGIKNKWAWFLMELPAILSFSFFLFMGDKEPSAMVWVIYGLFMIHYIRRTFVYPFQMRENGKTMPVVIVLAGISFNIINGFFNGYWLGVLAPTYDVSWFYDIRFISGSILFIVGMYINIKSDQIVLDLRKGGRKGYFIPQRGLYKYVSAPNLMGEIIEWIGWALLSWCLPTLSFALWSMANLIPRSLDHHRWYKRKFQDYPPNRKAIIPKVL
jgi:protein-S-isoprenylcysteine O-methyltransferase Ste14